MDTSKDYLRRPLFRLDDENNPSTSNQQGIWPETILDQVKDQKSPVGKNLRDILEDMRQDILTGGRGNIVFPVTSVNGMTDDVVLSAKDLGLGRVDNTSDVDKPLSGPQREAVNKMLDNYNFKVNMSELHKHMSDTSNPHGVTFDQLDMKHEFTDRIQALITQHNTSTKTEIHADIRRSLSRLWQMTDQMNEDLQVKIKSILGDISDHLDDPHSHATQFNKKEDIGNKVQSFSKSNNADHVHYPSTKAVIDFVLQYVNEVKESIPNVQSWIDDIIVISSRESLPAASAKYEHKCYYIRNGITSQDEISFCRKNPDGKTYSWNISTLGSYSKFNQRYFVDTIDGLSLDMKHVVEDILFTNGGELNNSIDEALDKFYTRDQIDNFNYINRVKILPGTMDGTIKYYVNDDLATVSEDVKVSGLKRLAYLEWLTENELADQAVHERHIISNAVARRHVQKKAVNAERMSCGYGKLLGNILNSDDTAHEIDVQKLVEYIKDLPGGGGASSSGVMQYHRWMPGEEYALGDGSYARRFLGTISVLPNVRMKTELSDLVKLSRYRLMDAGGSWVYQSKPEAWTIMGGSNLTGHTYGTVIMDGTGLFFETISTGDRFEAPYDIWVRYIKSYETFDPIDPTYDTNACEYECTSIEDSVIADIIDGTYDGPSDDTNEDNTSCGYMTTETLNKIIAGESTGSEGDTESADCQSITPGDIQNMLKD